ncbi:MAG: hypothetical protein RSC48_05195, partial [Anaerorhabdus sp.]
MKIFIIQSNIIHSKRFYKEVSNENDLEKNIKREIKDNYFNRGTDLKTLRSAISFYSSILRSNMDFDGNLNNLKLEEIMDKMIKHVSYRNISNNKNYILEINEMIELKNIAYLDILRLSNEETEKAKIIFEG